MKLFIPPLSQSFVGIIVDTTTLCISLLDQDIHIHEYQHNNSVINLAIFNTSALKHSIKDFLSSHNALNSSIALIFNGPGLYEKIVPDYSIFTSELVHYAWDTFQLSNSLWYIAGIHKSILFQYQLVARELSLNIQLITTAQYISLMKSHEFTTIDHYEVMENLRIMMGELQ